MNILFIIDPIEQLDLEIDTTFLIMAEAYIRKHTMWIATLQDLRVENGIPCGTLTELEEISRERKDFRKGVMRDTPLSHMSVIFMRKDPPFTIDYVMATYILSLVQKKKTFIINDPAALRNFNEKMGIFQFSKYIPPTIVTKQYKGITAFLQKYKKIVLKPLEKASGQEVIVLDSKDKNRNSLLEMLTHNEKRYLMAQEYLPEAQSSDKRVILLNGKIIGQYVRFPHPSDHRSNFLAGGTYAKTILTQREKYICLSVAKRLASEGIYLAGIDIIGGYLVEINVTSPGGFKEVDEFQSARAEEKVLDFLEKMAWHGGAAKDVSNTPQL